MRNHPITQVTEPLQYRAIGLVRAIYKPEESECFTKGYLLDQKGDEVEAVVLGRVITLMRRHLDMDKPHLWVVYPRSRKSEQLHLQIAGIWDPYKLNDIKEKYLNKNPLELLEECDLSDNYFSIRGELIYVNTQKKEFVMKICSLPQAKKLKNNNFKIVIKGELSLELLNNFLSLDVIREGSKLRLLKYEVVRKNSTKPNNF